MDNLLHLASQVNVTRVATFQRVGCNGLSCNT